MGNKMSIKLDGFIYSIAKEAVKEICKNGTCELEDLITKRLNEYSPNSIYSLWEETGFDIIFEEDIDENDYNYYPNPCLPDIFLQINDIIVFIIDEVNSTINEILEDEDEINLIINSSKKNKKSNKDIKNLYKPKKIKLSLDLDYIKKIKKFHIKTEKKLDTVLKDDNEKETGNVKRIKTKKGKNIKFHASLDSVFNSKNSYHIKNISFNEIQQKLIIIFMNNNFEISNSEIIKFSNKYNVFKSQLINSINEVFYEIYEENLIEFFEDDEKYKINDFQIETLKEIVKK